MSYKKIGIIGGAGPEATYKLHKLIIEKCIAQGNYYDWEFPHLIIDNVPFEDLVANKLPDKILKQFEESLKFLETRGASQILVNCNSIYALINTDKYNIVNLPEQVYQILKKREYTKVGLLATSTTINAGVYDFLFEREIKVKTLNNEDQKGLDNLILNVAKFNPRTRELEEFVDKLKYENIDAIILGCTELSLFPLENQNNIIDTVDVLADLAVKHHFGGL